MNEEMRQLVWLYKREETERNSAFVEENLPVSSLDSQSQLPEFKLSLFLDENVLTVMTSH